MTQNSNSRQTRERERKREINTDIERDKGKRGWIPRAHTAVMIKEWDT